MSRIEEIKKSGYTIRFFDHDGNLKESFSDIRYYLFENGTCTLETIKGELITGIKTRDFPRFDIKTKAA